MFVSKIRFFQSGATTGHPLWVGTQPYLPFRLSTQNCKAQTSLLSVNDEEKKTFIKLTFNLTICDAQAYFFNLIDLFCVTITQQCFETFRQGRGTFVLTTFDYYNILQIVMQVSLKHFRAIKIQTKTWSSVGETLGVKFDLSRFIQYHFNVIVSFNCKLTKSFHFLPTQALFQLGIYNVSLIYLLFVFLLNNCNGKLFCR